MVATDGIRTVVCVLGTRPEAVKMAPVIQALRASPWCRAVVVSTGQHRELLAQTLGFFDIRPDHDLDLMAPDQTLAGLTAGLLSRLDPLLVAHAPALVRQLAARGQWLEQEVVALDPRLAAALEDSLT